MGMQLPGPPRFSRFATVPGGRRPPYGSQYKAPRTLQGELTLYNRFLVVYSVVICSVADPDPHVIRPPGSTSQRLDPDPSIFMQK